MYLGYKIPGVFESHIGHWNELGLLPKQERSPPGKLLSGRNTRVPRLISGRYRRQPAQAGQSQVQNKFDCAAITHFDFSVANVAQRVETAQWAHCEDASAGRRAPDVIFFGGVIKVGEHTGFGRVMRKENARRKMVKFSVRLGDWDIELSAARQRGGVKIKRPAGFRLERASASENLM
jgi:hypothetical protein